jgi:hypothetical protein
MPRQLPLEIIEKIILCSDFTTALLYGNKYIINKLFDSDKHNYLWAAKNRNLIVMDYLYLSGYPMRFESILEIAANNNDLEMIKYIYKISNGTNFGVDYNRCITLSVYHGNFDIVEFLIKDLSLNKIKEMEFLANILGHSEIEFLIKTNKK